MNEVLFIAEFLEWYWVLRTLKEHFNYKYYRDHNRKLQVTI